MLAFLRCFLVEDRVLMG